MKNEPLKARFRKALFAPDPLAHLIEERCPGVFVFDAFERDFCAWLLAETEKHEQVAPNSMNKYGLVLKEVGLGAVCERLLYKVVNPLVRRFYPHIGHLANYHGFIVNYDPKKQASLDIHEDSSAVTLNVCLGREFAGGKLLFRDGDGKILARIEHAVGQAVLHLGKQQHQARNIRSGQRSNLILWCSK